MSGARKFYIDLRYDESTSLNGSIRDRAAEAGLRALLAMGWEQTSPFADTTNLLDEEAQTLH